MTQIDQLKFCSICKHQKEDIRKGIVCGLTNEIADFEETCSLFAKDSKIPENQIYERIESGSSCKIAGSAKRYQNLYLDLIFIEIIAFICAYTIHIFIPDFEYFNAHYFFSKYPITLLVAIIYYTGFEATTGQTIAKYITKTKVVTETAEKPSFMAILIRTLCRFIPFEPFSFMNENTGWHDSISKTKVIRTK